MTALVLAPIVVVLLCALASIGSRPKRGLERQRAEPSASVPLSEHLGGSVRSLFGRGQDRRRDRDVGRAIIIGAAVVAAAGPAVAVVAVTAVFVSSLVAQRRRTIALDAGRRDDLAEVVDLLTIVLMSGGTIAGATRHVARWVEGPYGDAFDRCIAQVSRGRSLADCIEELPAELGSMVVPLAAALAAGERHGAPVVQNLTQLAIDSRGERRRRAETAARRLPVRLLPPLVVCVLPAFLLVTVVPVIAHALTAFDIDVSG